MPPEGMVPLTFPVKGLDVNNPYVDQPKDTTPVGTNVRVYDQILQRARGGSRSGISKYVSGQVAPGLIQELNTVAYVSEQAIGSVNYSAAFDTSQTVIQRTGTYILGRIIPGGFAVSVAMAVDANGVITVGASQPGYPQGQDLGLLPVGDQIILPTGYFIVAYWQPGIFPLVQGNWQDGNVFPGRGFMLGAFPGAFLDNNFGFPP